jgi:hypothetical protein
MFSSPSKDSSLLACDKSSLGLSSVLDFHVTEKEDDESSSTDSSNIFSTPKLKKSSFESEFNILQYDEQDKSELLSPIGDSISSNNQKENCWMLSNIGTKELKVAFVLKQFF